MLPEPGETTRHAADQLQSAGLSANTAVRDPQSVIVDEGAEWGVDLIMVGFHGYTGIKRLVLGSAAQSVMTHASCSVEIIIGPAAREK